MIPRPYIVGNWKMNGLRADLGEIEAIARHAQLARGVDVAICPPFTLIDPAIRVAGDLAIGAQDCHAQRAGAHTGCISAEMLAEMGSKLAIVGHSERRSDQHETSVEVARKADAAHRAGLMAIICVGESLQIREAGRAVEYVVGELGESLPDDVPASGLTIAYEPVWAIGTGKVAEVTDIAQMHLAIRQLLLARYDESEGQNVRILYGGSVNAGNAAAILATANVNGALVGGASLKAESLAQIIDAAAAAVAR